MAGSSLFALIDDIATLLDDVAVLTKVAAKKTAGVLGDDLALNAQQVSGVNAERELPVVWAVAKGSAVNKAILVPAALLISAFAPWAITPMLIVGGLFLCFEGVEKIAHRWLHPAESADDEHRALTAAFLNKSVDMREFERQKIKGAIRTDFILSAEIIVIALGTVAEADLVQRFGVLAATAVLITVGVYGLVALIVKIDDLGLYLQAKPGQISQRVGRLLLLAAPKLMRFLSVAGTAAMFLVGGGILTHGIGALHALTTFLVAPVASMPAAGLIASMGLDAAIGILAGAVLVLAMHLVQRARGVADA